MGTRLYVGNLSFDTTPDTLREVFSALGTVSDLHVATDRDTGRARGFAFVTMGSEDEARRAISDAVISEKSRSSASSSNADSNALRVRTMRASSSGG